MLKLLVSNQSRHGQIARVPRRIHTDYADDLDVGSLAREANMGVSTFHNAFRDATASSPLQYLKSIALGVKAGGASSRDAFIALGVLVVWVTVGAAWVRLNPRMHGVRLLADVAPRGGHRRRSRPRREPKSHARPHGSARVRGTGSELRSEPSYDDPQRIVRSTMGSVCRQLRA